MEKAADKSSRRNWTKAETEAFLEAYGRRQAEFLHTRKKKYAMQNVLEDLLAQEVLTQYTTREMLEIKLKNLLRAFKATKDNNKRTGESPSTAPHEDKMQELFGNRPEIRNTHTLNLSGKPIIALPVRVKRSAEELLSSDSEKENLDVAPPATTSTSAQKKRAHELLIAYRVQNATACRTPKPSSSPSTTMGHLRERKSERSERNNILAEYAAKKISILEAAEKAKEDRYERKEKLFRELFQK